MKTISSIALISLIAWSYPHIVWADEPESSNSSSETATVPADNPSAANAEEQDHADDTEAQDHTDDATAPATDDQSDSDNNNDDDTTQV